MLLRVSYVLAVVLALDEPIQANFISPKSVEEIVKTSPDPIPNENCKSKFTLVLIFDLETFFDYIDVGDGCWRQNVLAITLTCW